MGLFIEDGAGTGSHAQVKGGRLKTYAMSEAEQHAVNEDSGEAFSILVDATTIAVNDQFFYMKNTGAKPIHITSVKGFVGTSTEVKVLTNISGTRTSATAITPVSRTAGSGVALSATVEQGVDLACTGGDGDIVDLFRMDASLTGLFKLSWGSTIILPRNGTICLESSAASTINLTVSCFVHS